MYNCLVLGPGGANGSYEIGALLKLEHENMLSSINTIIGCSIGSIIGYLYAIGYKLIEIVEISFSLDKIFNVQPDTEKTLENGGIFDTELISLLLENLSRKKGYFSLTFEQLYIATGLDLRITTTKFCSNPHCKIYSKKDNSDSNIIKAIIKSISIPGIFPSDRYIDGAFSNPYPIDIVDNGINKIIGIYIIKDVDNIIKPNSIWSLDFLRYILIKYETSMTILRAKIIQNSSENCLHIGIKTDRLGIEFMNVSRWERLEQIYEGYLQTSLILNKEIISKEKRE